MTKRNRIFIGILVAYALGVAFLMYRQLADIDPRYRESAEESLVETAQLLAALIEHASADGALRVESLEPVFRTVYARRFKADIYGIEKTRVELRATVVDRRGNVVFDSRGAELGADHSRWHDVFLALKGQYGARTTADIEGDPRTSVMYVAVPIYDLSPTGGGAIVGAVSVGKPVQSFGQFVEAARKKTLQLGATSVVAVLLLVIILSLWLVRPFGVIADYVRYVREQRSFSLPRLGRRALGAIGAAYDEMRDALAGRNYVADYVQTLTHEVKGPLSAIRGAAELLQEPMAEADRSRFIGNIARETQRIQEMVDRMLELTELESRRAWTGPPRCRSAPWSPRWWRAPRRRPRRAGSPSTMVEPAPAPDRRRCLPAAARARQPDRQRARLLAAGRHRLGRGDRPCAQRRRRHPRRRTRDSRVRRGQGVREVLFARPAGDGEEEHRARPGLRQGDRRSAPRPHHAEEPRRRRRGRDLVAAADAEPGLSLPT